MQITRLSTAEVLESLRTSSQGLDDVEALARLQEFGPNRIAEVKQRPLWQRFLREFTHFFALILWAAAAIAFFAGSHSPGEPPRSSSTSFRPPAIPCFSCVCRPAASLAHTRSKAGRSCRTTRTAR